MPKRERDLYERLCSLENLFASYREAARGKRAQANVASFELALERNLVQLHEELRSHSYRPGPYRSFWIRDPKRRLISAAPFRDRVVHHAICRIMEPLYERRFIGDSYANRRGRGTHRALDRAQAWSRTYRYVLQCDLREFFPSIDHEVLLRLLSRAIGDADVLRLATTILEGGRGVLEEAYSMVYFEGDDLFAVNRPRGLPIGNLTSQFWANVYLDDLDQFVKRRLRCRAYLRYADDFLLFGHSKRQLWSWKAAIRERLADLRLTQHERKSTVFPVRHGIPFLGFVLFPNHRRLRGRNVRAFSRRLAKIRSEIATGETSIEQALERLRGWIAHARHGDTWRLRTVLLRQPLRG